MKYLLLITIPMILVSCQATIGNKDWVSPIQHLPTMPTTSTTTSWNTDKKEGNKTNTASLVPSTTNKLTLDKIKIMSEKVWSKYTNKNDWLISYYDTSLLEQDIINSDLDSDGLPENSIQISSKEKDWNKDNFLNFIKFLSWGNIPEATEIYNKYSSTISPFWPTCCAWSKYDAHKPLKNGILSLASWWQENANYMLMYTFYKEGILYEISLPTNYIGYRDEAWNTILQYSGNPPLIKDSTATDSGNTKLLISWFNDPAANKEFAKIYEEFLVDITRISE